MLVVDRTHPLDEDLAWAPSGLTKRRLWSTKRYYRDPNDPSIEWILPWEVHDALRVPGFGELLQLVRLGAERLGGTPDRSASYDDPLIIERLLEIRARAVGAGEFAALSDGTRLRVEGRVVATETFPGVLTETSGVARRLVFRSDGRWWVHEALADFEIEDDDGNRIALDVTEARFITYLGPPRKTLASELQKEGAPTRVRDFFRKTAGDAHVRAVERVLEPDTRVSILGLKRSIADPSGYRDAAARPVLAGGIDLPLLIMSMRWQLGSLDYGLAWPGLRR